MEEDVIKKNHYALGIIGALIGAFVGAIPWILAYVFGNVMYSLLAILIVIGSYYGYKITKATIDKKLPIILSICSFISITVTMFLIIPLCLLAREELEVSFETLSQLYQHKEFMWAILQDYGIALIFCIALISGIIANLHRQLKEGVEAKDIKILGRTPYEDMFTSEDIDKAQQIFERNDATDKTHTITRELIVEELAKEYDEEKANKLFDYLLSIRLVKRTSNKYYFSAKNYEKFNHNSKGKTVRNTILVIIIIFVILVIIGIVQNPDTDNTDPNVDQGQDISTNTSDNVYETNINNIKIEIPTDMTMLTAQEIEDYLGEEYANVYDCIAMDDYGEKIISIFSVEKDDTLKEYTPEQYLKSIFEDSGDIEVKTTQIGENTFYFYEETFDESYIETATVYDAEDKFLCLDIYSSIDEKINLEDIIK